jgi:cell division protein FtsB
VAAAAMFRIPIFRVVKVPLIGASHARSMVSDPRLRSILSTLCLYVMAALLVGYFGINAYTGDHGLRAKKDLDREIAELSVELKHTKAEHDQWQRRVSLLRSDSLDPDMVEERARALLGYVDPRDVVVLVKRP